MQNLRLSQWGWFCKKLQEDYIVYPDVNVISDIQTKANFMHQGIKSIVCIKMVDSDGRWIGNLCADFTHRQIEDIEISKIKAELKDKVALIQFIIPEYKTAEQ